MKKGEILWIILEVLRYICYLSKQKLGDHKECSGALPYVTVKSGNLGATNSRLLLWLRCNLQCKRALRKQAGTSQCKRARPNASGHVPMQAGTSQCKREFRNASGHVAIQAGISQCKRALRQ